MSLPNVVAAIVLITGLTLACGASEETPARDDPAPAAQPTAPAAQSQTTAETTAPAATDDGEEENKGPQPPPKDELIKFANWDDNPVKLLNWIAGYIIAHGLDRPIRVIDVEEGAYQEPLLANDVDIVIAADGAWAEEQSGAGKVLRLGNASPVDATFAVVLHPSMEQRAPDVVRFLESMTIEAELLSKQSAMIRGGRVGLKENAVGVNFLKREYAVWMNWVGEDVAALVTQAIEDGDIGHCRQFITMRPTRQATKAPATARTTPPRPPGTGREAQ